MNKKGINLIVSVMALLLTVAHVEAQTTLKNADMHFSDGAYYSAVNLYRQLLTTSKDDNVRLRKGELLFRVGECYRKMNQPEEALKWYEQSQQEEYDETELYYGLGCVQLILGDYKTARESFVTAKDTDPGLSVLYQKIASCDLAELYGRTNNLYELTPLDRLNTKGSEFGLAFYQEKLIYASTGIATKKEKNISGRTGLPYSDIYMAASDSRYMYSSVRKLEGLADKSSNDGTFSYDAQKDQLYCMRCEANKRNCYIAKVEIQGDKYKESGKLQLGNQTYGIGHPYITDDGNRIYFASVMEGGYGGSDLWYVDKDADGNYGVPVNLGQNVNTAGDEVFPAFIDGVLYFSSDGHIGLGGLDIYASNFETDVFGEAQNLRAPFNSSWDDFNMVQNVRNKTGLLVSNRTNNTSSDDIYTFNSFPPYVITLDGGVYDNQTKALLKNYKVVIKDGDKTFFEQTISDSTKYFVYVIPNKKYQITAVSAGYDEKTIEFNTANTPNFSELNSAIYLDKSVAKPAKQGSLDSTNSIAIKDIFYEFNKYRLTSKSKKELDKYVVYFVEYPEMTVEIGSHTDARGTNAYNQRLSEERAKSVVYYLISKGIEEDRLVWKGYGESQLLIPNAQSEAEHQANRRTIFKILSLKNVDIKQITAADMLNSPEGAVDLSGWWVQVHVSSSSEQLHLPVIGNAERVTGKEVQLIKGDDGKSHYCVHYNTRNDAVKAQALLLQENIKTALLHF